MTDRTRKGIAYRICQCFVVLHSLVPVVFFGWLARDLGAEQRFDWRLFLLALVSLGLFFKVKKLVAEEFKETSEQSDGEATSKSAPEGASSEASHP